MSAAELPIDEPVADHELDTIFAPFESLRRIILAVSGGPDSTALLFLAHRWRKTRRIGPNLFAATVDHQLRPRSRREAEAVADFARTRGIEHHILTWSGRKPSSGLQEAAREARYTLLVELAHYLRAEAIVTAHTLDDQAETLLMRLARGSGLTGLGGIRPKTRREGITVLRPLLTVPKKRLIATLRRHRVLFAEDPSNVDSRFLRARLREIAPGLAAEGLSAERLATVARRLARAEDALESIVSELQARVSKGAWPETGPIDLPADAYFRLPDEIAIRLLGRAIGQAGDEGPVELAKLEALHQALADSRAAGETVRRTLAGALIGLDRKGVRVVRAPVRKRRAAQR